MTYQIQDPQRMEEAAHRSMLEWFGTGSQLVEHVKQLKPTPECVVICLNACAGIPDDQLAGLRVGELLKFLRDCRAYDPGTDPEEATWRQFAIDALAIARGEGGA